MSVVAEELQLESDQRYNNEKIIPEAQLLERPFDIINGLKQAAQEGIVPQVADAISLAHLPNPGFKITHEINPHAQTEANDGKAAIVAGICGITKSCEDRCCPIGDLDKARVRVGLINELKLNDPDFFNNPNADKIIKDRVNEIMEQRQNIVEVKPEEKKPKVEIPTGFFGKKLSPEEAQQKMEELSGTYSQGKKVKSPESQDLTQKTENIHTQQSASVSFSETRTEPASPKTESIRIEKSLVNTSKPTEIKVEQPTSTEPTTTIDQKRETDIPTIDILQEQEQKPKIPDHIKEMMQSRIKKPSENTPIQVETSQKPTEISITQPIRQEFTTPTIPQQRIDRHRTNSESSKPKVEQTNLKPSSEKPQITETSITQPVISKPEIQQRREIPQPISVSEPKNTDTNTNVEQTLQIPLPQESVVNSKKPTSNSPLENNSNPQAEIPKPINPTVTVESTFQQPPKIISIESNIPIPQREINTVQSDIPEVQSQKVENIQLNESVIQIPNEITAQSPTQKTEFQQIEPIIRKPDSLQVESRQPVFHEETNQHNEQTIQIPKLEIPQIQRKDFIPDLTTIRFTQEAIRSGDDSIKFVVESIPQEPQLPKIISIGEQSVQEKIKITQEIPVIKTEASPSILEKNTDITPTLDVDDTLNTSTEQSNTVPVQTPVQKYTQTVSINMQDIQKQTIVDTTFFEQVKIQSPQIEGQMDSEVVDTQLEEIANIKPTVENPQEQSVTLIEPITENSLEQLLTTLIPEQTTDELVVVQEPQAEPEVIEFQEQISETEKTDTIFSEDTQFSIPDESIVTDENELMQQEEEQLVEPNNITTEDIAKTSIMPELLDNSIHEKLSFQKFVLEPTIVSVEASQEELPQIIEGLLLETEFESEPILVFAIPENTDEIETTKEIVELESSEEVIENNDEIQEISDLEVSLESNDNNEVIPETPQQEHFVLQFLNQEQVFNFMYAIQDITDLLSFLHEHNQQNDSIIDFDNTKEMAVTQEELKNDTFGKYDDSVIMTVWPIVQFMLYIQSMQIFIPQKQNQLTTVT